jgi:site-specific recombinase XerD
LSYRRSLQVASTRVVQEMLGHANIRQTKDTYSHVLSNMQQQAAERMDAMLG